MSEQMSEVTSENCRRCGKPLPAGAKLCTGCGTYVKSGVNAKTVARAKGAGKLGLAMIVGATAAVIGGVIWAGIAVGINMEIGYVAWGIGGLTGFAVIACTQERSARVAMAAAGLAVLGILIGKCLTIAWVLPSVDKLTNEIASNDTYVAAAIVDGMVKRGEADADVTAYWKTDDDEPPTEAVGKKVRELMDQAAKQVSKMSRAEKRAVAKAAAKKALTETSYVDNLKAQLSPWDALWLFLAVGTAWKMGAGQEG